MGTNRRHIINKQIIEVHMPKTADAHDMQNKVSALYREKLIPLIDKQLSDRYGSDDNHYQVEKLTIDLGEVHLKEIETVFVEKLTQAIASHQAREPSENHVPADDPHSHSTPLKVLSYYLVTGILPWWAGDTTKAYLHQQFEELLKTPGKTLKEVLGQLRFNHVYLERFLNTFTGEQVLQALQLLTTIPVKGLSEMKKRLVVLIHKDPGKWSNDLTDFTITKTFWRAAFDQVGSARNYPELESQSIRHTLQALGAGPNYIDQWVGRGKGKLNTDLSTIRELAAKLKKQYPHNTLWQQFFKHMTSVLSQPSLHLVNAYLLKELKPLLVDLEKTQSKSVKWLDSQMQRVEALENSDPRHEKGDMARVWPGTERFGARLKTVTETNLQPLAKHLHKLETTIRQEQNIQTPRVIEKLPSEFEDTGTIPVENAGLVILWPFLQRFFENLDLITGKAFHDESTRNKAVCALQYLADEEEEQLFEGMLALNKVLCGIPLEDTVELAFLSPGEKETGKGLLQSVISRGPHWKNLSLDGFRTSYLQREGLLRTRDGHWLLQVKKETYDVTLEKLPWGFQVVKLPWMEAPLMVEWT